MTNSADPSSVSATRTKFKLNAFNIVEYTIKMLVYVQAPNLCASRNVSIPLSSMLDEQSFARMSNIFTPTEMQLGSPRVRAYSWNRKAFT